MTTTFLDRSLDRHEKINPSRELDVTPIRRKPLSRANAATLLTVALVALAGSGVGVRRYAASHRQPSATYTTRATTRRDIVCQVTASGTLSALVTVQVGTQVSGRIQTLNADFNSVVKRGQVVAKIDPQLFEAAVQQSQASTLQAEAAIASARASATNAEKQLDRVRALRQQNLAAQSDLDTSEANAATARASLEGARASFAQAAAQLRLARINLSYTNIVSPIDGVVLSRNVDVGQTVAASLATPTLFTIAQDLTKMEVATSVAEGDIGRLRMGMQTFFTVDSFPDARFVGTIREIRNAATTVQNVVTYDAVIDVDNRDLRLRPGMTANVTIIYAERPRALAVPNAALRFRSPIAASPAPGRVDVKPVWVTRAGALQPVFVHAGLTDGAFTEVSDGDLNEGQEVIVGSHAGEGPGPMPMNMPPPGRPPGPMF